MGSRSHKKHIKRVVVDSAVVVDPEQVVATEQPR